MKNQLENINCYLCGEKNDKFLFNAKDRLLGIKGVFKIVQCQNCGLIYLNPRPKKALLNDFYPQNYYHIIGLPEQPEDKLDFIKKNALISQRKRIFEIENYHKSKEDSNILDVGCGAGSFLYAIKNLKNCNVCGIDLSPQTVKFCCEKLDLDVKEGSLLKNSLNPGFFDIITMWHYFEHEMEPSNVLKEARRLLKDRGVLILEIPNAGSFSARFFKSRWFGLDAPRHLVQYDPYTLEKMLNQMGFNILEIKYNRLTMGTAQSFAYLLNLNWKTVVTNQFFKILFLLFFYPWFVPLEMWCSKTKRGDIIRVYCTKN